MNAMVDIKYVQNINCVQGLHGGACVNFQTVDCFNHGIIITITESSPQEANLSTGVHSMTAY